ncbi:hypothetical protein LTR78_005422 [Recurvomyces mirabilis]|uniref:Metallo-beta-lactamase domain-containing protein n=1 Tax=Recurvomyces mirabilis TaxID=574656 RepID=A0AAE0WN20_9PEZI|nr:hypothetical protein LTR78_005422 [Recurvomyces mirabilis]KAK5152672.1 hypothetical protein LTS14_008206 [Recurvomyces mirabilis]
MESGPSIHPVYENSTRSWMYIVADTQSKNAVVIDPVLDAAKNNHISTNAVDDLLKTVRLNDYTIDRVLETHGSGPGRSAAWYLRTQIQERTGTAPRVVMGKSFAGVQRLFQRKYGIQDIGGRRNLEPGFQDGQIIDIGGLRAHILQLPTQTQGDHLGYLIGSNIFIGEPALTVDYNISRSDFNDESAHQLWLSIQRLLGLPKEFRIYSSNGGVHGFGDGKPFATVEELRSKCKLLMGH